MVISTWKEDKIRAAMWGVTALFLLFCFISMYYSDIWETYHDSLTLLDCLADGRLWEYYEIKTTLYFIPIYVIFGIWNLPVWIITRFFQVEADSAGCLLWSKGIIVLFAIGCIWITYGILKKLEYDDPGYAVFLFVSSLLFIFPTMVASQYDVVELFFLLCAMFYYVKDEKLSWRVILFFSVAISVKLFAVFIFLLLVLTVEKRILYIVRNIVLGVSFTMITMLPFWNRGYWNGTSGLNISFAYRLLSEVFPGGLSPISIFLSGYFMLCAVAYFSKKKDVKNNLKFVIWLSAVYFMLLFTFARCNPYWMVLYLPFIIMVVIEHKENLKINILIESAMEVVVILMQGIVYSWIYFSGNIFSSLLLKPADIEMAWQRNLVNFLGVGDEGISLCLIVANTIFFACEIVLLIVNNPWKPVICESSEKEFILTMKISRIARVVIMALLLVLMLFIVF